MDAFSDSGELFTIRNQFFTNQHHKITTYQLDQFSPENRLKVLEYQIRSVIALGEDASQLIETGKALFPDEEHFFQLLSAYDDLKSFGTDESTYFDDIKHASFELQAALTAIYIVKFGKDIDQAIKFLTTYIDSKNSVDELEPLLILIQLYLVQGNYSAANKVYSNFKHFPDSARDNIIYQVLESWLLAVRGETSNISNSYYFYDEWLSSSDFDEDAQGRYQLLNSLYALTIQLKHFPEAQNISEQIKSLDVEVTGDFIANEITYDHIVNGGANVDEFLKDLKKVDAEHHLLVDHLDKNIKFDEVVSKYEIS